MKDLYPFEGRFLDLGGARMHYLDEGRGQPVVMLHGNPTWSFYYRNLILALRDGYRVVAPDHIGCGLSDKPGDEQYEYTLGRRVDDLERLLDAAGVSDGVTLVLHDWGGMIGMAWAARHPERVRRLVVMNTSAFHLPPEKRFPWPLWLVRNTPLGPILVRGLNLFCRGACRWCVTRRPMPRDVRRAYRGPYNSWKDRIAVLRFVQDIPLGPGDPSFGIVSEVEAKTELFRDTPVLVCWGMRDFVFDHHFLALWERHFPEARVHRFEDCGHYVLEDAADEIIPLVKDFLATT